jgi:hypothetical protein
MKTQVIQLEPHDDIISARDKMGWGQTQRIVLVWPKRRKILNRRLDILLLQRYCREHGAEVGFVCRDADVKFYAYELGIPVFPTVPKAQTTRWRKVRRGRQRLPRRQEPDPELEREDTSLQEKLDELRSRSSSEKPSWLHDPSYRLGIFSIGVLAVLAVISALVPSAEITLHPATRTQSTAFIIQANPGGTTERTASEVQSHEMTVVVEGRAEAPTTGQIEIPELPARGTVRFSNLTDQLVNVPLGTVVRTLDSDSVRFVTTEAGRLLPGTDQTLNLHVEAVTRGEAGNLRPNTILGIEGPLGLELAVTNPLPTNGGKNTTAPAPTEADRLTTYQDLLDSLQDTAADELRALLNPNDQILTPLPVVVKVHREDYDPPDLQPADRLSLLLRVEFAVQVAPGDEISTFVTAVMDRNLAEGYAVVPETLHITPDTAPVILPNGEARWELSATRELVAQLTSNQAINLSLGLTPEAAETRLMKNLALENPPQINLNPSWWPRLPILPFRIQIEEALRFPTSSLTWQTGDQD